MLQSVRREGVLGAPTQEERVQPCNAFAHLLARARAWVHCLRPAAAEVAAVSSPTAPGPWQATRNKAHCFTSEYLTYRFIQRIDIAVPPRGTIAFVS